MKLAQCLTLMALVCFVVVTAINCVQNNSPTPTPTASPSGTPSGTPTPEPMPTGTLTWDQQLNVYNTAIQDPYVRERVIRTAWRNTQQAGDQFVTNTSYLMGQVGYMRFTEHGPDYEGSRALAAAEIIPGNLSEAGVNVIAFVDLTRKRVVYVGFVPRPGIAPAPGVTFTSTDEGVDEREPAWDTHRYYFNATIVDTGYVKGQTLTDTQKDQASYLAMLNTTVRGYIGEHQAGASNFTVYSYETGYPYRYILAYPMVTIDVTDGPTRYDTIYVLVDLINNRVVRVEHGEIPII